MQICQERSVVKLLAALPLLGVLLTFPPVIGAQTSLRQSRPLRVAYMSTSVTMAPLWMAKEIGGFAKEGIEVEMLSINASAAMPALIANELDAIEISAAPVLTASLRGQDVIFVAGLLNTMIWNFYVSAIRAGIERYYADKAFALKVIAKYNKENDPDFLDKSYEFYRKAGFRRELLTSEQGVQGILDFLSETIPEAKKASPAQFFDDRFVRQVNAGK